MFKNYLVTTIRNLVRNKVNTIINIAGLTISIACCIVIYVFVKHEKTFDSFHKNANRIYRIVHDEKTQHGINREGYSNFAIANALRNDFQNLETVTQVYINNNAIIKINNGSKFQIFEEKEMTFADEEFLKTFDYPILAAQKKVLLSTPDEVVITKQLADKFFGALKLADYQSLLGNTITVNKKDYRISAILNNIPRNTNVTFKMLLPIKQFFNSNPRFANDWKNTFSESYTFVTLPPDYSATQFDAALVPFKNKYLNKNISPLHNYHPQPLSEVHTDEHYGGTYYATPSILIVAFVCMGIIVLLTACINFINLATAQSLKRAKEVGIRKTLGSREWQLKLQFMCETFLLILIASITAVLLANWFLGAFNQYLLFIVELNLHIDQTIIYFLVALMVIVTLLAGYYPAKVLSSYNPIEALRSSITTKNTGFNNIFSFRKALVVTQFAVSQLLIIGTIVVASQMDYFYEQDLGFRKDGIFTVEIPENDPAKLNLFRNTLLAQSAIQNVTFNSGPPTSASTGYTEMRRKEAAATEKIGVEQKYVDPNYVPTYEIKLIAGRNVQEFDKVTLKDTINYYNAVVNKKAISKLGFASPAEAIGQQVIIRDRDIVTIVGVTDDFYNVSLQREIGPCLLFYGTNWVSMAAIKTNGAELKNIEPLIKQQWQTLYPDYVFKSMPLTDYFKYKAFYLMEDIMYKAFKVFVVLSVFIGCLGLYGLVSFLSLQRQKEIGIRKVLGASVKGIVYMFSKEFAIMVVVAFVLAAPLGYIAMKTWLQTFAHRIELTPVYFIAALVVSLIVAALTVSTKAIQAAVANPVKNLRTE